VRAANGRTARLKPIVHTEYSRRQNGYIPGRMALRGLGRFRGISKRCPNNKNTRYGTQMASKYLNYCLHCPGYVVSMHDI
jgi:hypothetical protein